MGAAAPKGKQLPRLPRSVSHRSRPRRCGGLGSLSAGLRLWTRAPRLIQPAISPTRLCPPPPTYRSIDFGSDRGWPAAAAYFQGGEDSRGSSRRRRRLPVRVRGYSTRQRRPGTHNHRAASDTRHHRSRRMGFIDTLRDWQERYVARASRSIPTQCFKPPRPRRAWTTGSDHPIPSHAQIINTPPRTTGTAAS